MTDLIPYQGKKPIVMKSGLVHWVSDETAERFQQQLQTQTAHTFVRLKELSITINSAEVEGVYTMEEYENLSKVKQGMWQCEYNVWHNKGKRECECKADFYKRSAQARKAREKADDNRPMTAAERERSVEKIKSIGDSMRAKGILPEKKLPPAPKPVAVGADDMEEDDDGMPDFIE